MQSYCKFVLSVVAQLIDIILYGTCVISSIDLHLADHMYTQADAGSCTSSAAHMYSVMCVIVNSTCTDPTCAQGSRK